MSGANWVCARGATLAKMIELGHYWAIGKLPAHGRFRGVVFEADASAGDLTRQWLAGRTPLPVSREARARLLLRVVEDAGRTPVLLVREAHRLSARRVDGLRALVEKANAALVLIGDVPAIEIKTRTRPGVHRRMAYLIDAQSVFE